MTAPLDVLEARVDVLEAGVEMLTAVERYGALGWVGLAAFVVAWDGIALRTGRVETLSRAFTRNSRRRLGMAVLASGWLVLTCHLFGWPPRMMRLDPIGAVARVVRRP